MGTFLPLCRWSFHLLHDTLQRAKVFDFERSDLFFFWSLLCMLLMSIFAVRVISRVRCKSTAVKVAHSCFLRVLCFGLLYGGRPSIFPSTSLTLGIVRGGSGSESQSLPQDHLPCGPCLAPFSYLNQVQGGGGDDHLTDLESSRDLPRTPGCRRDDQERGTPKYASEEMHAWSVLRDCPRRHSKMETMTTELWPSETSRSQPHPWRGDGGEQTPRPLGNAGLTAAGLANAPGPSAIRALDRN